MIWTEADNKALGREVRRLIRVRSRAGIGLDGQRLTPKADGTPSRLTRTGRLLRSLRVYPGKRGVSIKAEAAYSDYVDDARPFMGLTEQQLAELDKLVEQRLDRNEREYDRRSRR